jgi:hypothetical protein
LQSQNYFIKFLLARFGEENAMELVKRFYIGSLQHWPGSTIFWQVDESGRVRTGKIMLYDPDTGKRIREPFSHIAWVHSGLVKSKQIVSYNLQQCLFGLHQAIHLPESTFYCHCRIGKDSGSGYGLFSGNDLDGYRRASKSILQEIIADLRT